MICLLTSENCGLSAIASFIAFINILDLEAKSSFSFHLRKSLLDIQGPEIRKHRHMSRAFY